MGVHDLPQSYGDAARLLNAKGRSRATIANNTVVQHNVEGYTLYLHGHPIVTWKANGHVVLDSCGYRTVTTKQRLNYAQRIVSIRQVKGQWLVAKNTPGTPIDWSTAEPFFDGITFTDHDTAISAYYDTHGGVGQPACGD